MRKKCLQFDTFAKINIGGTHHGDLMAEAKKHNIEWNVWGEEIFTRTSHISKRFSVEIVKVIFQIDLPKKKKSRNLRPMIEEAFENNLCLCPASVGLEILLQTKPNSINEVQLAMQPVSCSTTFGGNQDNFLTILDKDRHYQSKRIIGATAACLDCFADSGMSYLFCRRHQTLVKNGFASLAE